MEHRFSAIIRQKPSGDEASPGNWRENPQIATESSSSPSSMKLPVVLDRFAIVKLQ